MPLVKQLGTGTLRIQGQGQPKCPVQPRDSQGWSQFLVLMGPNIVHRQEKDRENYEKMSEPFFAFLPEISRNGLR